MPQRFTLIWLAHIQTRTSAKEQLSFGQKVVNPTLVIKYLEKLDEENTRSNCFGL